MGLTTVEAKAKMSEVSSDSITMTFVDPFDQRNGRITAYSVIVTTDKADTDINKGLLNKWRDRKRSWLVGLQIIKMFKKYLADVQTELAISTPCL